MLSFECAVFSDSPGWDLQCWPCALLKSAIPGVGRDPDELCMLVWDSSPVSIAVPLLLQKEKD